MPSDKNNTQRGFEKTQKQLVEIRQMGVNDLSGVLSIEKVSFRTPWSEGIFRDELFSSLCHSLVATVEDKIVGYICFAIIVDEVHLRNISVHKDFRRCGIASQMMSEMIRTSQERGVLWSTLEVRRSNTAAIQFYEKYGFEIKGIRRSYYRDTGEDAFIMWVNLKEYSSRGRKRHFHHE
ncbi:MAG: ribosomal protein S18-alanine N-acetyltransferase [Deltaproteobacteria bacterium]|nr:ribosomal protein S18-alanine N-acetyltransferase [Deltaproteobacteria bacterium]